MKKKILFVSNYPVNYRVDFYNELFRLFGHDCIRFAFVESGERHVRAISVYEGEPFHACSQVIDDVSMPKVLFKIARLLLQFRPDVVVITGFPYYLLGMAVYRILTSCRFVIWWAGTAHSECDRSLLRMIYRRFFSRLYSDGIFYSRLSLDYYQKISVNLQRTYILGNNTRDSHKIYRAYKSDKTTLRPQRQQCALSFITVGFQNPSKNTMYLLEAARLVKDSALVFELVVIGDGEELPRLRAYASQHDLPVVFHGAKSPHETLQLMSQADVMIHPSLKDRSPQTYTEAICLGLPVLISKSSGVDDAYVSRFADEVVFDPCDISDIAQKMRLLIESPALVSRLGDAALETAFQHDGLTGAKDVYDFLSGP
ncbi:glycosyltransferase family 4 protein [Thiorhodovibrio litoralis]|uniref:glycosyltransferase family 4 protein n=1 Tax=Thiorhodovibrio litoralis TaxID=2952932 RepID=UPI002B256B9F|nr:glycosyltransferase family 4 protein [Thiorhodovibrio litoralis]WPL10856.1 Putative glycosyltransferase EpsF [Thiorhodovibrio litoralis]